MARISAIFDSLQSIDHPNIVGFHKYWFDQPDKSDKPRVSREDAQELGLGRVKVWKIHVYYSGGTVRVTLPPVRCGRGSSEKAMASLVMGDVILREMHRHALDFWVGG